MVGRFDGQVFDGQAGILHEGNAILGLWLIAFRRGDESGKAMQAIDPCGKLAEGFEVIDNHRQRAENRRERAGRLDRPANLQFPEMTRPAMIALGRMMIMNR